MHVARKGVSVTFPCRTQLVAASNPCPCGYLGDGRTACRCNPAAVERYRGRLSGPFLDRFDLRVMVSRLDGIELLAAEGESSAGVRNRVMDARRIQRDRGLLNRELGRDRLDAMAWDEEARSLLAAAVDRWGLTGRGWDRVRRVARTIADLDRSEPVGGDHVAEALSLRAPV